MTPHTRWLETAWGQTTWAVVFLVIMMLPTYAGLSWKVAGPALFVWTLILMVLTFSQSSGKG